MAEYAATGLPLAYLPKHDPDEDPLRGPMTKLLLTSTALKFHPFRPDVPPDALFTTPAVDSFVRRVELGIADGGFAMITGDPGTGKSIALRVLSERLRALPDVLVGTVEHPQESHDMDFYRELSRRLVRVVPLAAHNRWAGFKALRTRWADHIGSSRCRPVLIIDEAQEALTPVLCELLNPREQRASIANSSSAFTPRLLAGDARLPERLRSPELQPLGSRIRRRLTLDYASRDELLACLDHLLTAAGNPSLMTSELRVTLADHAAGNYRVLMNLADELLAVAADRESRLRLARLDEKLFLEVFAAQAPQTKSAVAGARKR